MEVTRRQHGEFCSVCGYIVSNWCSKLSAINPPTKVLFLSPTLPEFYDDETTIFQSTTLTLWNPTDGCGIEFRQRTITSMISKPSSSSSSTSCWEGKHWHRCHHGHHGHHDHHDHQNHHDHDQNSGARRGGQQCPLPVSGHYWQVFMPTSEPNHHLCHHRRNCHHLDCHQHNNTFNSHNQIIMTVIVTTISIVIMKNTINTLTYSAQWLIELKHYQHYSVV